MKNISKNQNLYPQQSQITLFTLPLDTLYIHLYISRWGFTPLIEAERFQHDFVFRYLARHVEDNYPEALEELLKKSEEKTLSQR